MKRRPAACRLALAALLAMSGPAAAATDAIVAGAPEPATLSAWNRPLATLRGTVAGIPPAARAENARARIARLPESAYGLPVTTHPATVGRDSGFLIAVGDHALFGLVPADLDPEAALTLDRAAAQAAARVQGLMAAKAAQRELPALLRGAALAILALLAFATGTWLVFRLRRAAIGRFLGLFQSRRFSIGGIDLIPTLATVERATFRVLSWLLVIALGYGCLTFAFRQFPLTAPLGDHLGDFLRQSLTAAGRSAVLALPSLLGVVAVLLVTRALSLWVARLLVEIEHGLREVSWLAQEQAKATRRIASGAIWMLGIATAYPMLPWSRSLAFQGMSVVLGFAVSFASGGIINHWVSGLMLLYARSFRVGEFVSVGGTEGIVTEMGSLATKLRTMRREVVTIPNGQLATDRIVNHTRLAAEGGALLSTAIAIGYDVPWPQVRGLLTDASRATEGVAAEPPPRVLPWELDEFCVRYQLHVRLAPDADRVSVRAELNTRILDAFSAAGVQIMTPHFESQPDARVIAPMAGRAT
jgi:small-conductance mechanosensitive channel